MMSVGGGVPRPRPGATAPAETAEQAEGAWRWLRRKFINDQAPLFDGIRRVMGGREFAEGTDVEASAKNVHGRIRARQERLQRRYVNRILEMLSAPGMSRDTFNSYAMALHALERNAMIRDRSTLVDPTTGHIIDPGVDAGSGMGDLEAQDIIERVERGPFAEGYRRAAELLAEMNREVLDGAVRDGILSAAQAETWKRMSPHYVPLKDAPPPRGRTLHLLRLGLCQSTALPPVFPFRTCAITLWTIHITEERFSFLTKRRRLCYIMRRFGESSSVGRAPDCGSGCRGIVPRLSPQFPSLRASARRLFLCRRGLREPCGTLFARLVTQRLLPRGLYRHSLV